MSKDWDLILEHLSNGCWHRRGSGSQYQVKHNTRFYFWKFCRLMKLAVKKIWSYPGCSKSRNRFTERSSEFVVCAIWKNLGIATLPLAKIWSYPGCSKSRNRFTERSSEFVVCSIGKILGMVTLPLAVFIVSHVTLFVVVVRQLPHLKGKGWENPSNVMVPLFCHHRNVSSTSPSFVYLNYH